MMSEVLFFMNIGACLLIVFTGLFMAINNMSRCTDHVVRMAWVCITTGAFGVLAGAIYGHTQATVADTVLHIGVAIFAIGDRRRYRREASREDRGSRA
jgi:hypothetical protein